MDEHIEKLNAVVEEIRNTPGPGYDPPDDERRVPDFNDAEGHALAKVLFVQETPNREAVKNRKTGTGNKDATAENMHAAWADARLDPKDTASWNVVPWLGKKGELKAAARQTAALLVPVIRCMLNLKVVVLCGDHARNAAWPIYAHAPEIEVLISPHSSNNALSHPGNRERLYAAVERAAYVIRKGSPNGGFASSVRKTFREEAPNMEEWRELGKDMGKAERRER